MASNPPRILVVGCGNVLRTDDGVGPTMIRHLRERGVPEDVEAVDGGTAGIDVAFRMRGAQHVILVDACVGSGDPGTIHEVPASEVVTPPLGAAGNLHGFRWDHAVTFGRWLLKDEFPESVTAFLIEADSTEPGLALSPPVREAMHRLIDQLLRRWADGGTGADVDRSACA